MSETADLIAAIQQLDAGALVAVREAVSRQMLTVPLSSMTDDEVVAATAMVETGARRDDAVKIRWAVELRERGVAAKRGLKPARFLSTLLRLTPSEASARSKAAERVGYWHELNGELRPAAYPAAAAAMDAGDMEFAHYRVIHRALTKLPTSLRTPEHWSTIESDLANQACALSPDQLESVAQRLLAYLNPDGEYTDDADRARRRDLMPGRQDVDHMSGISGTLDPATRALWDVVAAKWAQPGMNNPEDPESPMGDSDLADSTVLAAAAERDNRTQGQRDHDAFKKMLETVVGSGTLGKHRGQPAIVVATMTLDELETETGIATTASGGTLPVRDALALAGSNRKFLALLDNAHRPLFLGREKRLASAIQRIALIAAERGCSRPGCDQPATRTAVHHMHEWKDGGRTDITVLTLVCDGDHAQVHDGDGGWITEIITSGNGPPEWVGRVGWRQRGTDDALTPNDTHFPDRRYQRMVDERREKEEAHAAWFRQRAKDELAEQQWRIEHPIWHREERRWLDEVAQLPDPCPPPESWYEDVA